MPTEIQKGLKYVYAKPQAEWHSWMEKNHKSEEAIWLILYRKDSGKFSYAKRPKRLKRIFALINTQSPNL